MADQARDAGWSFEDYLAAVLEREVSARNASGAELRIKAAGLPSRKTLEDFDWDAQPATRQQIAALASGGFLLEAQNVVLLGPPGRGRRTSRPRSGSSLPATGTGCCSRLRRTGSPASPTPTGKATCHESSPGFAVTD
ncbi:ATP-binding protein [Microbacterium laevaniformans]